MERTIASIHTGIFQNNQHKSFRSTACPTTFIFFVGFRPHQSISALIQNVKAESTKWIKPQNLWPPFVWQEGYGSFSYSKSQVPDVIRYIQNQEEHHRKQSFLEEYKSFLKAFEIDFDEQNIFKEPIDPPDIPTEC